MNALWAVNIYEWPDCWVAVLGYRPRGQRQFQFVAASAFYEAAT